MESTKPTKLFGSFSIQLAPLEDNKKLGCSIQIPVMKSSRLIAVKHMQLFL
jgi:hypothetical protein